MLRHGSAHGSPGDSGESRLHRNRWRQSTGLGLLATGNPWLLIRMPLRYRRRRLHASIESLAMAPWEGVRLCIAGIVIIATACRNTREHAERRRAVRPDWPEPQHTAAIEFAGCTMVEVGPVCTLPADRRLTWWVSDRGLLVLRTDRGTSLRPRSQPLNGGMSYDVLVPEGVRWLNFAVAGADHKQRLMVRDPERAPPLDQAKQLRARGEFALARSVLEAKLPTLPPRQVGRAKALLARLALSRGELDAAIEGLGASLALAEREGRISDVMQDGTALSFLLCSSRRQYAAARAVLDHAGHVASQDPASQALLPHYQGVIAQETGDLRTALASYREAVVRTHRLGLQEHEVLARAQAASVLAELGRYDEAVEIQRVLATTPSDDPCLRSDRFETVTWFALLAEPSAGSSLARIAAQFSQRSATEMLRCPSPWRTRNHAINAALLALVDGDTQRARRALRALPMLSGEDYLLDVWEHEAQGRLRLAARHPRAALSAFQQELELAQRGGLWENLHLAWLGRARALLGLSRLAASRDSYLRAEALLEDVLGFVPLSEGQAGFQHAREAGTRELIGLLLRMGDSKLALNVARRARMRVLRAISRDARLPGLNRDERAAWEAAIGRYRERRDALERAQSETWRIPSDALEAREAGIAEQLNVVRASLDEAYALLQPAALPRAAPELHVGERELVLAVFPTANDLKLFAINARQTRAFTLSGFRPTQSGDELAPLVQTALDLQNIERVRVISHGELASLDMHALLVGGTPLLQRAQVVYSLDSGVTRRPTAPGSGHRIVVVGDPGGDLAAAKVEAHEVVQALNAAQPELLMRADATRARVLRSLLTSDLFHFAGHVRFAGREGIDSGLVLSDGELSLGDILTLSRVPEMVVLSACEGARTRSAAGFSASLGLAQAFVAAGSRAVVATTRAVPDELARTFFAMFYEFSHGQVEDAARALQQAALQQRALDPESDWAAFRLFVP